MRAAKNGDVNAVRRELTGHINVDFQDEVCSQYDSRSLKSGILHTYLILLQYFSVCVQEGRSAIYFAAWNGHHEIVCDLIQANANVNLQDKVC